MPYDLDEVKREANSAYRRVSREVDPRACIKKANDWAWDWESEERGYRWRFTFLTGDSKFTSGSIYLMELDPDGNILYFPRTEAERQITIDEIYTTMRDRLRSQGALKEIL